MYLNRPCHKSKKNAHFSATKHCLCILCYRYSGCYVFCGHFDHFHFERNISTMAIFIIGFIQLPQRLFLSYLSSSIKVFSHVWYWNTLEGVVSWSFVCWMTAGMSNCTLFDFAFVKNHWNIFSPWSTRSWFCIWKRWNL